MNAQPSKLSNPILVSFRYSTELTATFSMVGHVQNRKIYEKGAFDAFTACKIRRYPDGYARGSCLLPVTEPCQAWKSVADLSQVYFWTTIRKNRAKYNLTRGISEDHVTAILLRDVVVAKDPQAAEESLLKLSGLRRYVESLRTNAEKEHFKRHMRKYINMWLPDCPFEVSTTNRYTIVTHEAATTARRFIKKGQTIKHLSGYLVSMTPEEEKDLDLTRRDFSIVMSSRKKSPSLFLGPARFANHDCNANARLATHGPDGMQVVAVRDILLGEEITVTYGDNYFGEDNCECLCLSCEKEGRNGWAPIVEIPGSSGTATPLDSETEGTRPYLFRKARKSTLTTRSSLSATPDTPPGRSRKRRKTSDARSLPAPDFPNKTTPTGSSLRNEFVLVDSIAKSLPNTRKPQAEAYSPSELTKYSAETIKEEDELRDCVRAAFATVQGSKIQTKRKRKDNMEWLHKTAPMTQEKCLDSRGLLKTPRQTPNLSRSGSDLSEIDSIFDNDGANISSPATTPSAGPSDSWKAPIATPDSDPQPDSDRDISDLSELSENEELDDIHFTVVHKPKPIKRQVRKPKIIPSIEDSKPPVLPRIPGDYVRTPLLLGETYTRWVDCQTCAACWVQPNGYLTRKECPRCERHSKLYGYQWPKTDKLGKDDDEERVMDHRTVHRFIKPTEEAQVKKRYRGIDMEKKERSRRGRSSDVSSLMLLTG